MSEKGIAALSIILIIVIMIVLSLSVFSKVNLNNNAKKTVSVADNGVSKVPLKIAYQNPFDSKSQYGNPFDDNPFNDDSLFTASQ